MPTALALHPFVPDQDAPPALIGSDGRVFLACVSCGRLSHDMAHRGYRLHPALTDEDRHLYRPGEVVADRRNATRVLCATCGKARNSIRHRDALPGFVAARVHESVIPPQVRRTPRPTRAKPAPQLVTRPWLIDALLDATDRLLDLPTDDVSWSLRVRLVDLARTIRMDWPELARPEPPEPPGNGSMRVVSPAVPGTPPPANLAPRTSDPRPSGSPVRTGRKLRRAFASSDMRDVYDAAVAQGFVPKMQGDGHVRLIRGRESFAMSTTHTGGGRSLDNVRSIARRAGVEL